MRPPAIARLLAELAAICRGEGRPEADRSADALLSAPVVGAFSPMAPCTFDAGVRTLLAGGDHPAAAAILAAQTLIPWAGNSIAQPLRRDAAEMSAVATLLGPDGPVMASDLRLGLFYQKPDSYYPLHNHDADETYVILCGNALWTAGDDIRMRGPGSMVHHPSLMPHAFRAGPLGFLALWRWSGDINRHSYAFLDDPAAGIP